MDTIPFWRLLPQRVINRIMMVAGLLIAIFLGRFIATHGLWLCLALCFILSAAIWIFVARHAWWVLLPPFVAFSTIIYVGFKIFTHEIALALTLLAFLPMIVLGIPVKRRLPLAARLLFGYLLLHCLVSVVINKLNGLSGGGSILRVYLQALWPLIFMIPFYCFGDALRHRKLVLRLVYIAVVLRVGIALLSVLFPMGVAMLPFSSSFVLSGPLSGLADLRASGIQLALLSICYFHLTRFVALKLYHLVMLFAAFILVFFGSGRISAAMVLVLIPLWTILYRRYFLTATLGILIVSWILILNSNPDMIYSFPRPVQRVLSMMINKKANIEWHRDLEGSDEWHRRLIHLGYERWTHSAPSLFFGNRIEGYDEGFYAASSNFEIKAQIAARMGTYESGLWTMLGVTGVVGLGLYLVLYYFLMKNVMRVLWRERIRSTTHAFYLLASASFFLWVCFSWFSGGFPGQDLMLAIIAKAIYEEDKQTAELAPVAA